jgi:hypothetical protein
MNSLLQKCKISTGNDTLYIPTAGMPTLLKLFKAIQYLGDRFVEFDVVLNALKAYKLDKAVIDAAKAEGVEPYLHFASNGFSSHVKKDILQKKFDSYSVLKVHSSVFHSVYAHARQTEQCQPGIWGSDQILTRVCVRVPRQ